MRKFHASGAVLERSWAWLVIPAAIVFIAAWMFAERSYFGVLFANVAALTLAIGLLKKPRRSSPAAIAVEDGFVRADHRRLVAVDAVAGVSIVGDGADRILSITASDGRVIDLAFDSDDAALELRAVLGLALAPVAARRFSTHREIGPLGAFLIIAASLTMLVWTFGSTDFHDLARSTLGLILSLVGVPVVAAQLRRARLTCGAEGVLVEGFLRKRLIPWRSIEASLTPAGVVMLRQWPRLAFELSSRDDADLFIAFARSHGAASLPNTNANANANDLQFEAMLARGQRDVATWLADVHTTTRTREAYRQAHIDESRLWSTLDNPRAEPSARIGAAVALRSRAGKESLARVRAVAHSTSLADLRSALSAVADVGVDEAAVPLHVARALAVAGS